VLPASYTTEARCTSLDNAHSCKVSLESERKPRQRISHHTMTTLNPKKSPLQKINTIVNHAIEKTGLPVRLNKQAKKMRQADLRALKKMAQAKSSPVVKIESNSKSDKHDTVRTAGTSISISSGHGAPRFRHNADGSIEVNHTEYIGPVTGNSAFTAYAYPVNALNATLFPWLSGIALRYETYQFLECTFTYHPAVSTSENGIVMFGFDPDALDTTPLTMAEMMNLSRARDVNVWAPMSMTLSKRDLNRVLGQRFTNAGSTSQFDNAGLLFVASQGATNALTIGNWRVSYKVMFHAPQLHTTVQSASVPARSGTFIFTTTSGGTNAWYPFATGTVDASYKWLTTASFNNNPVCPVATQDCAFDSGVNTNAVSLPVGTYHFSATAYAASLSSSNTATVTLATALSGGVTFTTSQSNTVTSTGPTQSFWVGSITVTQANVDAKKNFVSVRLYSSATMTGALVFSLTIMPVSIYTEGPKLRKVGDAGCFRMIEDVSEPTSDCVCADEHKGPCPKQVPSTTNTTSTTTTSTSTAIAANSNILNLGAKFKLSPEEMTDFEIISSDPEYARRLAVARLDKSGPFRTS